MKKIAFTICLTTSLVMAGFAQISKGKLMLGATTPLAGGAEYSILTPRSAVGIGWSTIKSGTGGNADKIKTFTLDISPAVGYAVADNLVLGLGTNFIRQTTEEGDSGHDGKSTTTVFTAGPQVRYYLPGSKVRPFLLAHGMFGALKSTYEYDFDEGEMKLNISAFGGGAGVALFVNDAVSIDFVLGYQSLTIKDKEGDNDDKITQNNFGLNVGFSWFLK